MLPETSPTPAAEHTSMFQPGGPPCRGCRRGPGAPGHSPPPGVSDVGRSFRRGLQGPVLGPGGPFAHSQRPADVELVAHLNTAHFLLTSCESLASLLMAAPPATLQRLRPIARERLRRLTGR